MRTTDRLAHLAPLGFVACGIVAGLLVVVAVLGWLVAGL